MPNTYEAFAERLRVLIAKRNTSQAEVARSTNLAPANLSDWANTKHAGPGVDDLAALANHFDVSVDFLLGRTDCERPPASGAWIVDLDEERDPSSANVAWAIEIPNRFDILTRKQVDERDPAVRNRWRAKRGRHDASP